MALLLVSPRNLLNSNSFEGNTTSLFRVELAIKNKNSTRACGTHTTLHTSKLIICVILRRSRSTRVAILILATLL